MPSMKFSRLSLLSRSERRALTVSFEKPKSVLVAGNGFGKSAIVKSLYDTLGAQPHKVDRSWRDASVASLLEFEIDGRSYAGLKANRTYSVFDDQKRCLFTTDRVTDQLGPFLADMLAFRLVLTDKQDHVRVPPPSYAFAPFYVDQDQSWGRAWAGFRDLAMFPHSTRSLAEYHSGLKPNAFYEAQAERERIRIEVAAIGAERDAVASALKRLRDTFPKTVLTLNLTDFEQETDELVGEAQTLHEQEVEYRRDLAVANEERLAWENHVETLRSAIAEQDAVYQSMIGEASQIECPVCGQHYVNGIAEQFQLVAEKDDLVSALHLGQANLRDATAKCGSRRAALEHVRASIDNVDRIMATRKANISVRDIIISEGRQEADRLLTDRLGALNDQYGDALRRVADCEARMKESDDRGHRATVLGFFAEHLEKAAADLDVRIEAAGLRSIQGVNMGRGSEGPRTLAAYYYSFLNTARRFGSSAFCPIVIDAPNQQGQDRSHLSAIMRFLLASPPSESQVIIATEALNDRGAVDDQTSVIDISFKKNQVLREDLYTSVMEVFTEYLLSVS